MVPSTSRGGFFWQDIEQEFDAYQYAFNLGIIAGPDPVTGNEYDYNKHHFLDTKVLSGFPGPLLGCQRAYGSDRRRPLYG